MNKDKFSLSVVLPVYNEEENIATILEQIFGILPSITDDFEVIVTNDGSQDGTAMILSDLRNKYESLRVVSHDKNRGYGNALISGFNSSSKEYIFFMDSDGQFDFREIRKLLVFKDDYDIVAGIRIERKDSVIRDLNGTIFNFIIKFIFKIPIMDIDCGFKLFRKSVIKELTLNSPGALINTEILAKARRNNRSLMLVGVTHYPRKAGRQSGGSLKVIFRAVKEIIKLKYELIGSR